ncbi:MAG: hypothetical protein ABJO36_10405 [Litorimonas sp.]
MTFRIKTLLVAGASLGLLASPAFAGDALVSAGKLSVNSNIGGASNMTLSVSGPDGFSAKQTSSFGAPSVSLSDYSGMPDGQYTWQLTGATKQRVRNPKAGFDNGRSELGPEFVSKSFTETGSFRVVNGVVQLPGSIVEDDSDGGAN